MRSHDSKYFSGNRKGETAEWRQDLKTNDKILLKTTVKRIIAAMTVGKDVCSLFPDVINCMQTEDIELKKLVYLYAINYARSNPDLAILAVNTFVKDSQDPNPLIRALAVRTMGCIRVEKIVEYLCDPLHLALQDPDPYVRKTAAICVAKVYNINGDLVSDREFLQELKSLVLDTNPMVIANSIAALVEIQKGDCSNIVDRHSLGRVLSSLDACTEWGQVTILDCLTAYVCSDTAEAENIFDAVLPKLQHVNHAVVLACVRLILSKLHHFQHTQSSYLARIVPPLITMLSAEAEIQFIALLNIQNILKTHVAPFKQSYKAFFCKYNDPSYVKYEKLEVLVKLANQENLSDILLELKEYSGEIDIDFARKSIRAIGTCALSVPEFSNRCVDVLLSVVNTKINYAMQEAMIVMKDILRRYPDQYENMISPLCQSLESLDDPEAKKSLIWILGEYAERIDNVVDIVQGFIDGVDDEPVMVQLQLLTATIKLFLKCPSESVKGLVQRMLTFATSKNEHPDLRDRAYVYWRLLSHGGTSVSQVVTP